MSMDFAWHTTDLYSEVLSTPYCPIRGAISSFYLDAVSCVDASADFFGEVVVDDDDLGPGVENPMLGAAAAN